MIQTNAGEGKTLNGMPSVVHCVAFPITVELSG